MEALRVLVLLLSISGIYAASFTLINGCSFTVWPGILSGAGTSPLSITGLTLQQGESRIIKAPPSWSGRIWGRTHCFSDPSGKFACETGDCSSGTIECAGSGAEPPTTLAEFTLNGASGMDFYDVSLVDGYNLPMLVVPRGGGGPNCSAAGCAANLNSPCPAALKVSVKAETEVVACKSACEAFGDPRYCCVGEFSSAGTCKPTAYSEFFKNACPRAYSYAFDDPTSTFTCTPTDYAITFCPSASSSSSSPSGKSMGAATDSTVGVTSSAPARFSTIMVPLAVALWLWGCWQGHVSVDERNWATRDNGGAG